MLPAETEAALPTPFIASAPTPQQIGTMIWARRYAIALITAVLVVFTGVVSKLLPRSYEATATLLVDFEINDPLSGRDFSPMLAESYLLTQMEFMTSPVVLLPVVDALGLASREEYLAGYSGEGGTGLREWVMAGLARDLSVSQGKQSRFIYVTYSARDPQLAAAGANAVANRYLEAAQERSGAPVREQADRYGTQLESLRTAVDAAQTRVTEFRQRTGLIDLDQKVDVDAERLLELDRRLAEAESQRRLAEQRHARGAETSAAVLESALVQSLKTQLAQQEARMAELSATLGTRHPEYQALQAEIATTRERLQREIGAYGGGARAELDAARSVEQQLRREVERQRETLLETRRLQDEGTRYLRELESATKVYESALQGYDQILLSAQSRYSPARLVSAATPPLRHSRPKATQNVILALFAGLMVGTAICLLLELMRRRVRSRDDLERELRLPVLAELGEIR
ncbi:MAG TPA: GNVR domain-containing protein [Nevskiaceae bacterium]|nr:GNVR domain-containing protein [Nevskiaceae bacterium]